MAGSGKTRSKGGGGARKARVLSLLRNSPIGGGAVYRSPGARQAAAATERKFKNFAKRYERQVTRRARRGGDLDQVDPRNVGRRIRRSPKASSTSFRPFNRFPYPAGERNTRALHGRRASTGQRRLVFGRG